MKNREVEKKNGTVNLIWDLDGTTLDTLGVGVIPFEKAAKKILEIEINLSRKNFSGFTDIEILEHHIGRPISLAETRDFEYEYFNNYKFVLRSRSVEAIAPAKLVLQRINSSDLMQNYVGTGNLSSCAHLKLDSSGLSDYFPSANRFTCTHETKTRKSIIQAVVEEIGPQRCIVIGDTPKDIQIAKVLDIPIIAVATGLFSIGELAQYAPNAILPSKYTYMEFLSTVKSLQMAI